MATVMPSASEQRHGKRKPGVWCGSWPTLARARMAETGRGRASRRDRPGAVRRPQAPAGPKEFRRRPFFVPAKALNPGADKRIRFGNMRRLLTIIFGMACLVSFEGAAAADLHAGGFCQGGERGRRGLAAAECRKRPAPPGQDAPAQNQDELAGRRLRGKGLSGAAGRADRGARRRGQRPAGAHRYARHDQSIGRARLRQAAGIVGREPGAAGDRQGQDELHALQARPDAGRSRLRSAAQAEERRGQAGSAACASGGQACRRTAAGRTTGCQLEPPAKRERSGKTTPDGPRATSRSHRLRRPRVRRRAPARIRQRRRKATVTPSTKSGRRARVSSGRCRPASDR